MKVLVLLGACLLTVGCGHIATLEELENQALITGDWSEVERRERIIARRKARRGPVCPKGYMAYCESMMAGKNCSCISKDTMASLMYGH